MSEWPRGPPAVRLMLSQAEDDLRSSLGEKIRAERRRGGLEDNANVSPNYDVGRCLHEPGLRNELVETPNKWLLDAKGSLNEWKREQVI